MSLLALLGLASFVVVYVATEPPTPPADRASLAAPAPEPDAPESVPTGPASVAQAPATDDEPPITPPNSSEEPAAVAFELRPTTESSEPVGETVSSRVRNVTPPDMTAGPSATGPLTRVAPSEPEPETPAEQSEARVERLFNPIVVAAGTIKAGGRDIHLDGIAAPDFDERCGEDEEAWPCGRMARAALRRFIRGRAIECEIPAEAREIPDPATCRVAGEDIARWLVAQGWARRNGNSYGEEEGDARDAKLGLWGDGPNRSENS